MGNYLGANERMIIAAIQEMDVDGRGCRRSRVISMVKYSSGKSRDSIGKSIRNMIDKGMLLYDSTSDKICVPSQWLSMLKAGKYRLDLQPQALIDFHKRIEVLYMAIKNCKLSESEAFGLFGLLDLNKESILVLTQMIKNDAINSDKKEKNEFDILVDQYFNRKTE